MDNFSLDYNQTNDIIKEEIGGLAFILKYASIYIPYTTLSLIGFFVGLIGFIKIKSKFEK
jgi:hypothetical protein